MRSRILAVLAGLMGFIEAATIWFASSFLGKEPVLPFIKAMLGLGLLGLYVVAGLRLLTVYLSYRWGYDWLNLPSPHSMVGCLVMAKFTLNEKQRALLALSTAIVMTLDNATTLLAVAAGADELNPLVKLFLESTVAYAFFSVAKVALGFYVSYYYVRDLASLAVWAIVMFLFLRAVAINTLNFLQLAF